MRGRPPLAETLLAFAGIDSEALDTLDDESLHGRLQLATLVWNAVLLAFQAEERAVAEGLPPGPLLDQVIDDLLAHLGAGPDDQREGLEAVVRYLVVRKLEDHHDDQRAIGGFQLDRRPTGQVRLVVRER